MNVWALSYILDILVSHFKGGFDINIQILQGKLYVFFFWIAAANYPIMESAWILFCYDALLASNLSGANAGIVQENYFNTMLADGLAYYVAMSSATLLWLRRIKHTNIFRDVVFDLPVQLNKATW